ncbi:hypothetical protein EDD11_002591 [Mortierella claussenii]|nr:hypothetical protein EDD11_002591 [Mortierella claussenii]
MTDFHPQASQRITINLGDGLIMRWSTHADAENIVALCGEAFKWLPSGDPVEDDQIPGPNEFARAGARRLMSGKNAAMSEFDYALVEDTHRGKEGKNPIVAGVSLHRFMIHYGSVDLPVGKPELVASLPEYRNKGLIRKLFLGLIHPESDARGDVLQFIPGISYFYLQFGYTYGIHIFPGYKIENPDVIPSLANDASEPYILRQATQVDLPFINSLSSPERRHTHSQVGLHYTPRYWQYVVHDVFVNKHSWHDGDRDVQIIVDTETNKAVGFTVVTFAFSEPKLEVMALADDALYVQVMNPALRQLTARAKERLEQIVKEREAFKHKERQEQGDRRQASREGTSSSGVVTISNAMSAMTTHADALKSEATPFLFRIGLHKHHPLCLLLGNKIHPFSPDLPGQRLYTRIRSYPDFIKAVAPELEKRLAQSGALVGLTGRLELDFFRQVEGSSGKGLLIVLREGKIQEVKDWAKSLPEEAFEEKRALKKTGGQPMTVYSAAFSPLSFTKLVTGLHNVEELLWQYGENSAADDATRLVLNTLFPKVDHHFEAFYW